MGNERAQLGRAIPIDLVGCFRTEQVLLGDLGEDGLFGAGEVCGHAEQVLDLLCMHLLAEELEGLGLQGWLEEANVVNEDALRDVPNGSYTPAPLLHPLLGL
eukprot:9532233-Alexandrium_andersonii.AAC.1